MSTPGRGRLLLGLAGVTALALALRAVHLSEQPLIDDDLSVGLTAGNFAQGGWPEPTMWNHPRLRDLLVDASLSAFGETAWGLKIWSVALGTLSVAAASALLFLLTENAFAALAAGLLLATDGLHLDFSRQAINDVYLAFFPVAALAALLRYRSARAPRWLLAAGVLLGLGLATKWSAAFPVGVAAAAMAWEVLRGPPSRGRAAEMLFLAACLVALPLTVYLLTFLPWFGRGYSLAEWLQFQGAMALETTTHTGYGNKLPGFPGELVGAWKWFSRVVYYADDATSVAGAAPVSVQIVGIGNPLAWLLVWPACGYLAWRAAKRGDRAALAILALFTASYLPFAAAGRPIWTNSAVGVLPFALFAVSYAAAKLAEAHARAVRAWLAAALAAAAVLWFPAAGLETGPSRWLVRALVPADALSARPAP